MTEPSTHVWVLMVLISMSTGLYECAWYSSVIMTLSGHHRPPCVTRRKTPGSNGENFCFSEIIFFRETQGRCHGFHLYWFWLRGFLVPWQIVGDVVSSSLTWDIVTVSDQGRTRMSSLITMSSDEYNLFLWWVPQLIKNWDIVLIEFEYKLWQLFSIGFLFFWLQVSDSKFFTFREKVVLVGAGWCLKRRSQPAIV